MIAWVFACKFVTFTSDWTYKTSCFIKRIFNRISNRGGDCGVLSIIKDMLVLLLFGWHRSHRWFVDTCTVKAWSGQLSTVSSLATKWLRWFPRRHGAACFGERAVTSTRWTDNLIPLVEVHGWECLLLQPPYYSYSQQMHQVPDLWLPTLLGKFCPETE